MIVEQKYIIIFSKIALGFVLIDLNFGKYLDRIACKFKLKLQNAGRVFGAEADYKYILLL